MAKFCENCGAGLTPTGKFCGSCGVPVTPEVEHCPTCGQVWDGVKVEVKKAATPKTVTPSKPIKYTPPPGAPISRSSSGSVIAHNTTANVQPVYGSLYVEGKDCPNCGAANMANKICKTCESEN